MVGWAFMSLRKSFRELEIIRLTINIGARDGTDMRSVPLGATDALIELEPETFLTVMTPNSSSSIVGISTLPNDDLPAMRLLWPVDRFWRRTWRR